MVIPRPLLELPKRRRIILSEGSTHWSKGRSHMSLLRTLLLLAVTGTFAGCYYYDPGPGPGYGYGASPGYGYGQPPAYGYGPPPGPSYDYGPSVSLGFGFFGCCYGGWHHHRW